MGVFAKKDAVFAQNAKEVKNTGNSFADLQNTSH